MQILHILDTLSMGGAENLVMELSSAQVRLGHKVTVMPLVCPRYTIIRKKMEEKGVIVSPLSAKGSLYNPLCAIKIARIIHKYDIVHVHLFPALYWAGFANMLTLNKVSLIYTEHSTNNRRRKNRFLHLTDKIVYQFGYKKIVACSKIAKESFSAAFPSISHVSFINNGIDIKKFSTAKPYDKKDLLGEDKSFFLVTMVARFMSMKRQDTVVEAITKTPPSIHAVFVGGEIKDPGLERVRLIAEEKGISDRVHFLYTRGDVPRILKTSDVVVMASDYEGLSLSSVEGMASGKPFVASNVNGLREVVGGAGILFENGDSDELASILCRLFNDKRFYENIREKCQNRAYEYDLEEMTRSYIREYEHLLAS